MPYPAGTCRTERISPDTVVVIEFGAEDVIRRDDAFERGLDDLARSGGNDVKGEPEALDAVREEIDELRDVVFQTDAAAGLDQVFAPDAAKLRIVPDQIGELSALVDEITAPQSFDFGVETQVRQAVREHDAGVVEAESLIEVRCHQKVPRGSDEKVVPMSKMI